MMKKAQAAMEFLMTYGWAILVVLAAIGALAYLGILNPSNWTEGSCQMQGAFRCEDAGLDANAGTGGVSELSVVILSSVEAQLTRADISDAAGTLPNKECIGASTTFSMLSNTTDSEVTATMPITQQSAQRTVVTIDCADNFTEGDRYGADIVIEWTAQSGLGKSVTGKLQNIKVIA